MIQFLNYLQFDINTQFSVQSFLCKFSIDIIYMYTFVT